MYLVYILTLWQCKAFNGAIKLLESQEVEEERERGRETDRESRIYQALKAD